MKKLKEIADRYGFSVLKCGRKVRLIAEWEYEDGYKPSTIQLTILQTTLI